MSLKGDKYETLEEIQFRLQQTVVLYDGKPVYIQLVDYPDAGDKKEIARVHFSELPLKGDGVMYRRYLSSRKFDLTPFKMGYMNYRGDAVFITRVPVRQNKQGLATATVAFHNCRGKPYQDLNFHRMITEKGFTDMIDGKYPSFKEAGAMLDDPKVSSVAVSRSFAFMIDHDLEALLLVHKGTRCGIALKDDKAIKIPPKFHFLREEMEESNIPLA